MYASVIPAVRLPKDAEGRYDYAIPDDLAPHVRRGAWVLVPWRGRRVDGLVVAVSNAPGHPGKLKAIAGLGSPASPDEDVVTIVEYIAERYFCSPGTVAKTFLPKTPKTKGFVADQAIDREALRRDATSPRREVARYADPSWRDRCTVDAVSRAVASGRGALVLVPHAVDLDRTVRRMRDVKGATVVPVHGGLSPAKYRKAWLDLLANDGPAIVVGTRPAVLAPIPGLGCVVVHEADSADLKQYDQNPRYDARTVAVKRAMLANADVLLMSHCPRVEERALVGTSGGFVPVAQDDGPADAVLVDVSGKTGGTAQEPLAPSVVNAVKTALHGGKRVLLLHNRRGTASALLCKNCGHVFRCPRCDLAFAVHDAGLACHRCGEKVPVPDTCPKCSGSDLRTFGVGTAALERLLATTFPDATVARMDAGTGGEEIPDGDIVVGTRYLLHAAAETPGNGDWGCVAATSLDDLLAHAGFRVGEEAWRTVRTLRDVAAASAGTCYLQTVDPDNPRIRALLEDYDTHAERETTARRSAGYPPYGTLIAVTVVAPKEADAEAAAGRLVTGLKSRFGRTAGFSAAGPLRPATPFRHGKWRRTVVIKCRRPSTELGDALLALPEDHIIDRDPESIG